MLHFIYMSTHRKIEWSLFILGVIGQSVSYLLQAGLLQMVLFGIITIFAGLHVFHLYDGHKANHVVVAGSLTLTVYLAYLAFTTNVSEPLAYMPLAVSVLLAVLSLRLRRDFHPKV